MQWLYLRKLGHKWETVANAVKKLKARPYKKQKTPQLDDRIRKQRLAYAMYGPIAQLVRSGQWDEKKHTLAFVDHTPTSKNGAVNSSHDPCWLTPEDKNSEGVPSSGSSKYAVKPQVWLAVSYDAKILYIHAKRRRKKRHGPTIKPEYRLELNGVNSTELAYVVDEEFGEMLRDQGVETVIVDNDRKAHTKMVRDAWRKLIWNQGLATRWQSWDRSLIAEFTGEEEEKLGGFPVNSPDCMVNDQSVNNTWKILQGDYTTNSTSGNLRAERMVGLSTTSNPLSKI